jgi:PAS domain S-box-containing protein
MDYSLSDLVDNELVHNLMDDLTKVTGIPVGIMGVDGTIYFEAGCLAICSRFHRRHPIASQCCRSMARTISSQNGSDGTVHECANHLKYATIPIIIDGAPLASIYLGPFFFNDEKVDRELFRELANQYGFDESAYLAALDQVPVYPRSKIADIIGMLFRAISKLAEDGLRKLKQIHLEDELRQKQDPYYALFENMAQGVVYQNADGQIVSTNPAAELILGLPQSTMLNMDSIHSECKCIHIDGSPYPGEDHPAIVALRTGHPVKDVLMGVFNPQRDRHVWIIINSVPVFQGNEEKPYQVCTTFTEITEMKQAQEDLLTARMMLQTAVERSPAGIFILDAPGGEIRVANEAARQIIKQPFLMPGQTARHNGPDPVTQFYDMNGKAYADADLPFVQTLLHGITFQNVEMRVVNPGQSEVWILLNSAPIRNQAGDITAAVVIILEITSRKKSEIELLRYQDIVQNMQPGVFVYHLEDPLDDESLRLIGANPAAAEHIGRKPEHMLGHRISEILSKTDPYLLAKAIAVVARGGPSENFEGVSFDNSSIPTKIFSLKVFALPEGCAGVMMENVTQRVQTERALQESKTKFYEMVDHLPQSVFEANLGGQITFANRQAYATFGYTAQDMEAGINALERVSPEYHHALERYLTNIPRGDLYGEEFIARRKDGTSFPILAYTSLIQTAGEITGLRGVVIDISRLKQAEEEAHKNMQRFQSLFTNTMEGVALHEIVYDETGKAVNYRMLDVNPGYVKIIGIQHENIIGKLATEIYSSSEAPYLDRYTRVAQSGIPEHFAIFYTPLGKYFDISIAPLQQGQFATIVSDITQRIHIETSLQESEARLKKAQEVAHIGSWELDLHTRTIWGSPEAYRIYGLELTAEQALPLDQIQKMVLPQDRAKLDRALQNLLTFGNEIPYHVEYDIQHSGESTPRTIQSIAELVYDEQNQPVKVSGTIQDITERKKIEEEVLHLNDELEQRVRERTSQLEIANRDLESFAYSVSHDLRAPLRSLIGFSQVLLEDYASDLDETGRDYLQRIKNSSQHMSHLIDDILKLSRVSRSEMKVETIDLSILAYTIASELRTSQPDRQIRFDIAPNLFTRADGSLIRIALTNLFNNAWKFTSKKEHAAVAFGSELLDGQTVYFVRDNGAGFNMNYADKLFVPFQRLHTISEFEGTGIGLAIVQRIVQRHSGSIWAEANVDQGATFYFTLAA